MRRACHAGDRTGHMVLRTRYRNCVRHGSCCRSTAASPWRPQALKERYGHITVQDKGKRFDTDLSWAVELGFLLEVAEILVPGPLAREESGGGHAREDHPHRDDVDFMRHTMAYQQGLPPVLRARRVRFGRAADQRREPVGVQGEGSAGHRGPPDDDHDRADQGPAGAEGPDRRHGTVFEAYRAVKPCPMTYRNEPTGAEARTASTPIAAATTSAAIFKRLDG